MSDWNENMDEAPMGEPFLAYIHYHKYTPTMRLPVSDVFVLHRDDETNRVTGYDDEDYGWDIDDYNGWKPIEVPDHPNPPRKLNTDNE